MSLSMYQASVPVFVRALTNLRHVLQRGEAHAKAKNVSDAVLLISVIGWLLTLALILYR